MVQTNHGRQSTVAQENDGQLNWNKPLEYRPVRTANDSGYSRCERHFPLLSTLGLGLRLVLEALQPRSEGAV